MRLGTAIKTLSAMRDEAIRDGKVSYEMSGKLLEFVEPYVSSNNRMFESFQKTLIRVREDGVITDDESRLIIYDVEDMLSFLKTERFTEFVFGLIVANIIGFTIYQVIMKYIA